jgi:hypothetical protein
LKTPNHEYYPKAEKHSMEIKNVSLDKKNINTPFLISPRIAERTYIFSEKIRLEAKVNVGNNYQVEWQSQYEDDLQIFVPQNRWVHEVTTKPELVDKTKYKIVLDADVKMQGSSEGLQLISRTLLPYVEKTKEFDESFLNYYNLNKEKYREPSYSWIIRWTPKNACKLFFYSDQKIEDETLTKTPYAIIDYNGEDENIKVPFLLHKDLFPKRTYLRHDSVILYMEME